MKGIHPHRCLQVIVKGCYNIAMMHLGAHDILFQRYFLFLSRGVVWTEKDTEMKTQTNRKYTDLKKNVLTMRLDSVLTIIGCFLIR